MDANKGRSEQRSPVVVRPRVVEGSGPWDRGRWFSVQDGGDRPIEVRAPKGFDPATSPTAAPFTSFAVEEGERHLRLYHAPEQSFELKRIFVAERPGKIYIALLRSVDLPQLKDEVRVHDGRAPIGPGWFALIRLQVPLAGRKVIDASRNRPAERVPLREWW